MAATYSYNKTEKLKSRKALNALFTGGKTFSVFPVKLFYMPLPEEAVQAIQVGVGVSARHFKKAVDRNRIKRLLRECYRLNKLSLHATATANQKKIAVFFLYIGKELPEYAMLNEKMLQALTKLEEKLVR
ncbi:MAG: ribonuclease P protein component [Bacteroidota bacterium]